MTGDRSRGLTRLSGAAAVLLTAATLSACQGGGTSFAETETDAPSHDLSAGDARAIIDGAAQALVLIGDARADVTASDVENCGRALREADRLLTRVSDALPTIRVRDRIRLAKERLNFEGSERVLPDLVPVFDQLDFLDRLVPTGELRVHLDSAQALLRRDAPEEAQAELDSAGSAAVFTEIDLPVRETRTDVSRALAELSAGHRGAALAAIEHAEGNLRVMVVAVNGSRSVQAQSARN